MNSKLVKLQALSGALLTVVLAAEWSYAEYAKQQLAAFLNIQADEEYQAVELPDITLDEKAVDDYTALTERPLFIEGRKPVVVAAEPEAAQTVEVGQIDDWLLIGVFNPDKRQKKALFTKRNETKKYLKIAEGQDVSGWVLKEIQPDKVLLVKGDQQKAVNLRKPRPPQPPPITKPSVPPAAPVPRPMPNRMPPNAQQNLPPAGMPNGVPPQNEPPAQLEVREDE